MYLPNWAPTTQNDIFGLHTPPLLWRGSGNLTAGDVVALALDFAASAFSNPTANPGITNGNVNHVFGNATTMTTGNTQLGVLAVATTNVTAGTGAAAQFCLWSPDIPVKVSQGTGVTGAAGDFLAVPTDLTAAWAITAGQLFTQSLAKIKLAVVGAVQLCYGRALEASSGSAATKRCLFSGFGLFSFGTVG